MPTIWKGKKWAFQGDSLILTPGVGIDTQRSFAGEKYEMQSRAFALYNAGWATTCKKDADSPVWRVESVLHGTDIADVKELKVNVLNPSNLTSPYLQSKFANPQKAISVIALAANNFLSGKSANYDAALLVLQQSNDIETSELDTAQDLLDELIQGVTHYIQFQYVFRHTFNFGTTTGLTADFNNVGSYFTAEQLIAAEGIDTSANGVQIPAGEWLKIAPDQSKQLGQRKQLTYEYWWAQKWSRNYYPPMI